MGVTYPITRLAIFHKSSRMPTYKSKETCNHGLSKISWFNVRVEFPKSLNSGEGDDYISIETMAADAAG